MRRGLPLAFGIAVAIAAPACAQTEPAVALAGADGAQVLAALARECYEARLVPDTPSDSILDCSGVIEERVLGVAPAEDSQEDSSRIVVTHRIRFTLLERGGDGRIAAEAWTETEELGSTIDQPVTSEDYLRRVERVLSAVVARVKAQGAPPWRGRYESEQAWHLDAHLKAVSHCDANLATMTAATVAADLETVGLRALDEDTRDRCEQLYTHLFEWGLVRGDTDPTVAEYARYRAALPPEQRLCSGQLAPDASCR